MWRVSLRKGRTGLNTDFKLKNAESSTQKHIKQDSTTHSNTSKKTLNTPKSLNP